MYRTVIDVTLTAVKVRTRVTDRGTRPRTVDRRRHFTELVLTIAVINIIVGIVTVRTANCRTVILKTLRVSCIVIRVHLKSVIITVIR